MVTTGVGLLAGIAAPAVAGRFGAGGCGAGRFGAGRFGVGRFGARVVPAVCWGLVGAVAGALLDRRLGTQIGWLLVLGVGLPLAAIDLRTHRLPDVLVLPAVVAAAVLAIGAGHPDAVLAGTASSAAYAVLAVLPRSGLGFGDVKFAGLLGITLQPLGTRVAITGAVSAFVVGGVVALVLLATRRVGRDSALPFGPSMLAGAWIAAVTA